MSLFLASKIGLRYAYARKGSHLVGLNAILAILGISIGIAALIVVLSVMNGVITDVRDKMLSVTAPVSIHSAGYNSVLPEDFSVNKYLQDISQVKGYAPQVQGQGLIGLGNNFSPVSINGVDPALEGNVSSTFASIPAATRNQLTEGAYNVILGQRLVDLLNLKLGDKLTILVPQVTSSGAGILPRLKRFTFVGTFSSGHYQYDTGMVWVNMYDAGKLLQLDRGATSYQILIDNALKAPKVREEIQKKLSFGEAYASDWSIDNALYFNTVQTEKNAMFIILCLIVLVAAFGLLSSMYMVVTEKRRDIAILRTIGMTRGQIWQIFLSQGLIYGGLGMLIGIGLGILISINVPNLMALLQDMTGYQIPEQLYSISQLEAKIDPMVIIGISIVTLILTLLFSIIPAQIAAKIEPARALSYE